MGSGRGLWASDRVSASHLAHLIVFPLLAMVPLRLLRLSLRLPLALTPAAAAATSSAAAATAVTAVTPVASAAAVAAAAVLVGVRVLGLHLGAGVLLRSPPLQSAWWEGNGGRAGLRSIQLYSPSTRVSKTTASLFLSIVWCCVAFRQTVKER